MFIYVFSVPVLLSISTNRSPHEQRLASGAVFYCLIVEIYLANLYPEFSNQGTSQMFRRRTNRIFGAMVISTTIFAWNELDDGSNAASWTQFQGDAAHSGHSASSIDGKYLRPAWSVTAEDLGVRALIDGVVTTPNRVFVTGQGGATSTYEVIAVDRIASTIQWRKGFLPYSGGLSEPSVGNGMVYVHQWGHSGISGGNASQYPYVTGMNENTGNITFATSHSGQWSSGSRPTVAGSQVFAAGGYYGGLDAYNGTAGGIQWFAKVNQQYGWIPAADNERVYVYMGSASASPGPQIGTFYAFNRSTGSQAFTILNTDDQFTSYNGTVFVGDQNDAFTFSRGTGGITLVSFDLLDRDVRWRKTGNFSGSLAIDDGIIFAANGIELTLFDEATGNKLDSWFAPAGESLQRNLLVTEKTIFLGTTAKTYGIDRSTLEIVWQSDLRGDLAFGEDMLFISTTSAIHAFAIPEPSSALLLIVGFAVLHRRVRSR